MNEFKRNIFRTEQIEATPPSVDYCVTWNAVNLSNIRMDLDGSIDFTNELAGRNIDGSASAGSITSYIVNGTTYPVSIPFTFTLKKANFDTTLPAVENSVLTVITFSVEIICTNASEISLSNITLAAMETPDQYHASFDSCGV